MYILLFAAFLGFAFQAGRLRLLEVPRHFPKPVYDFKKNPLTAAKVELGRFLFYDPILSADNTVSCASCHSPYNAFSHTDHDLSHGIGDQIGNRNAPALFNLAWHPVFMWDGAVNHLDVQALAPISHPKEMAESIPNVVAKLQSRRLYRQKFWEAFGDSTITGEHVLKSLAQFQLTLVSGQARYDSVKAGKAKFTGQEGRGYTLFQRHCNACHREPLFSTYGFANNGLPIDTTLHDFGRGGISHRPGDSLTFKIPSLRNLGYSFPYMHDGRFKKLGQVLNHYTTGMVRTPRLSPELREPIVLSSDDKVDLISFLLMLNDKAFVFDSRHQFPKEILQAGEGFGR
ncbi:MAG TPA: cytochrome c peroxidase [Bacteroidia bacterium]|nr:cytochrome c peroxidase [Bacteroidia bacterium]